MPIASKKDQNGHLYVSGCLCISFVKCLWMSLYFICDMSLDVFVCLCLSFVTCLWMSLHVFVFHVLHVFGCLCMFLYFICYMSLDVFVCLVYICISPAAVYVSCLHLYITCSRFEGKMQRLLNKDYPKITKFQIFAEKIGTPQSYRSSQRRFEHHK